MNLKRIIREELNKTLLREDTVCPEGVWMSCGEFIKGCHASYMGIFEGECMYKNCCPGNGWHNVGRGGEGPAQPRGATMNENITGPQRVLCECPEGSDFEGEDNSGMCECKCAVGDVVCWTSDSVSDTQDIRR